MVTVALFVRIEAKPGKEVAVEEFLKNGLQIVEGEPATVAWFSMRLGPSTVGNFRCFPGRCRTQPTSFGAGRGGPDVG